MGSLTDARKNKRLSCTHIQIGILIYGPFRISGGLLIINVVVIFFVGVIVVVVREVFIEIVKKTERLVGSNQNGSNVLLTSNFPPDKGPTEARKLHVENIFYENAGSYIQ